MAAVYLTHRHIYLYVHIYILHLYVYVYTYPIFMLHIYVCKYIYNWIDLYKILSTTSVMQMDNFSVLLFLKMLIATHWIDFMTTVETHWDLWSEKQWGLASIKCVHTYIQMCQYLYDWVERVQNIKIISSNTK